jgi:hypothetical protein
MTTMTSREFSHDTSAAKRAAHAGPVFVTTRGRVTHVLLDVDDYRSPAESRMSALASLQTDDGIDLMAFIPPRVVDPPRPVDFE